MIVYNWYLNEWRLVNWYSGLTVRFERSVVDFLLVNILFFFLYTSYIKHTWLRKEEKKIVEAQYLLYLGKKNSTVLFIEIYIFLFFFRIVAAPVLTSLIVEGAFLKDKNDKKYHNMY